MQSEFYTQYIKSDAWEAKKEERKKIDGYRCVCCGRSEDHTRRGLQVHHITYERLGHENVYTDLCTVCGSCHKKIHAYYNRVRCAAS